MNQKPWEEQVPLSLTIEQINEKVVLDRMKQFGGSKHRAAKSLGITVKTVYNWLHRWGHDDLCGGRWPEKEYR